jgi:hypothetical protein
MVEALSLQSLLEDREQFGAAPASVSVDDLFRLSTRSGRLGTDTREAVSRPDESSHVFRDQTGSPIDVGDSGANKSDHTDLGKTQQPVFYGFAWRGIPDTTPFPMVFDLVKTIEWRPSPISGLTHAPPRTINDTTMIHKAVKHLDRHVPGWSDRLAASAVGLASSLAQSAFTGVATKATQSMIGFMETAPYAALTML